MSLRPLLCTFSRPVKSKVLRKPKFIKRTYNLNPLADRRPGITDALPMAPVVTGLDLSQLSSHEPVPVPKYRVDRLRRDFERVGNYMRKAISRHGGR